MLIMEKQQENITVAVRIRPVMQRELEIASKIVWERERETLIKERGGAREFLYDRVYDESVQTSQIFEELAKQVIEKCMSGYNGCIFCYGQTGSGKTFTMHGIKKNPGVVPLAIEAIFSLIQKSKEKEFLIRCSYIEIYNESVNDLLNSNNLNLQLAEDKRVRATQSGIKIMGVTEEVCTSPNQVQSLLVLGETHKNIASTSFNQRSSRAHSM